MKRVNLGILVLLVSVAVLAHQRSAAQSIPVSVDCSNGQSLNRILSELDKNKSYTVSVNGTCTEYVHIIGFENLTLKALTGAKLMQPATSSGNLLNAVLLIESSRSVTVQGFSLQADIATVSAVGIGHGSTDIRLRNLNVTGGTEGIIIFEHSQVSIAYVTAQDPGFTSLGIYDGSDVHLEHCVLQDSTGALWHVGMDVGASHITLYATMIRNMQVGITARNGSIVDVGAYNTYYPLGGPTDVTIVNSAGTNFNGVTLDAAQLNVGNAKLVIVNPGQSWGSTTGGVLVSDGSNMNATNGNLAISGSYGQGIMVLNNSHATLGAFTLTGSSHGGMVAANLSSIDVAASSALSIVGGNSLDLSCDSTSAITGRANIAGAPTVQCTNLLATETAPLP